MRSVGTITGAVCLTVALVRVANNVNPDGGGLQQQSDSETNIVTHGLHQEPDQVIPEYHGSTKKRGLRRLVYRVSSDAKDHRSVQPLHVDTRARKGSSGKNEEGSVLDYGRVPSKEDVAFWNRALQQSGGTLSEQNSGETNENTEPSGPPEEENNRFSTFQEGPVRNVDDNDFDFASILGEDVDDPRYYEWIDYRNSIPAEADRFGQSHMQRITDNFGRRAMENNNQDGWHARRAVSTIRQKKAKAQLPVKVRNKHTRNQPGRDRFEGSSMRRFEKHFGQDKKSQPSSHQENSSQANKSLDFFIAGFPKCGTTTLLYAFNKHNETSIGHKEECSIANPNMPDDEAYSKLNEAIGDLDPSSKAGMKCPTGLSRSWRGMQRLATHSPDARILVGVRHPVNFFQSFYNYRVTEQYNKNLAGSIPSVQDLVGSNEWRGVSTDKARFELYLMQLGKTQMTTAQTNDLQSRPSRRLLETPFKVFVYSIEQLEDSNQERATEFRREMQEFLHLKQPLESFGRENINHFVGEAAHPETVDICDSKFDEVRAIILSQAMETREWFRDEFLNSPDVTAGGEEHFLELLDTWGEDPCQEDSGNTI